MKNNDLKEGNWYMVLEESGGCHHTIKCGLDLIHLFEGTIEEGEAAKLAAKGICFDAENGYRHYFTGDHEVVELSLVFKPEIKLPLGEWRKEILALEKQEKEERKEKEEIEQLRKLQKKYGK